MQEIEEILEMENFEEVEEEEIEEKEEKKELVKPIKKVVFKRNTLKMHGIKVNLTKDKEYEVLSVKIPVQHDIKPSVNNTVLYLIKDDNEEKNYFRANFFENVENKVEDSMEDSES